MRDTYYEDTGMGRELDRIVSKHNYNEDPKCDYCDFCNEELMHLDYWMDDACD
jgi:hypothetical protein